MNNILLITLSLIGLSLSTSAIIEMYANEYYTHFRFRVLEVLIRSIKIFLYFLILISEFFFIWFFIKSIGNFII